MYIIIYKELCGNDETNYKYLNEKYTVLMKMKISVLSKIICKCIYQSIFIIKRKFCRSTAVLSKGEQVAGPGKWEAFGHRAFVKITLGT